MEQMFICDKAEQCLMLRALQGDKKPDCSDHYKPHEKESQCDKSCDKTAGIISARCIPVKEAKWRSSAIKRRSA